MQLPPLDSLNKFDELKMEFVIEYIFHNDYDHRGLWYTKRLVALTVSTYSRYLFKGIPLGSIR